MGDSTKTEKFHLFDSEEEVPRRKKPSFHLFDSEKDMGLAGTVDTANVQDGEDNDPDVVDLYSPDSHVTIQPWDENGAEADQVPEDAERPADDEEDAPPALSQEHSRSSLQKAPMVIMVGDDAGDEEEDEGGIQPFSRDPSPASEEADAAEAVISISQSPSFTDATVKLGAGNELRVVPGLRPRALSGTFPILASGGRPADDTPAKADPAVPKEEDQDAPAADKPETVVQDAKDEAAVERVPSFPIFAGTAARLGKDKSGEGEGRAERAKEEEVVAEEGAERVPSFPIFAGTAARLGKEKAGESEGRAGRAKEEEEEVAEEGARAAEEGALEGEAGRAGGAAADEAAQRYPMPQNDRARGDEIGAGEDREEEEVQDMRKQPKLSMSQREGPFESISKMEDDSQEDMQLELFEVIKLSLFYLPFLVLFLLVFTEVGYGATVFKRLVKAEVWANDIAIVGALVLLIMYLLDFSRWDRSALNGALRPIKYVCISFVLASIVIAVILTFRTRPYAPLLCYLCGSCVLFFALYRTVYPNHNLKSFLENLGFTIVLWGLAGVCASLVWAALSDFWWGEDSRREFRERLRVCENMTVADDGSSWCLPYGRGGVKCPKGPGCVEIASKSACEVDQDDCLAAFLLWGSPWILSVMKLVIGASLHFIAAADAHGRGKPELQNTRIYLAFLMVFILLIWLAASIASASPYGPAKRVSRTTATWTCVRPMLVRHDQLAGMVSAIAVCGLAVLFALLGCVVGFRTAGEAVLSAQLYGRIMSLRRSDWLRGALVLTVSPFFAGFLLASFVNQRVRRLFWKDEDSKHPLTGKGMFLDEYSLTFTAEAHQLLNELCLWDWTSVITKAIWWGFIYFVMQVGVSQWITLFMAWLNIQLAGASIWAVSAYIFLIAQCLFAIPVVPGVPAYIACGVIIGSAGMGEGWSFGGTMVWGIFVAQMCKQAACLIQQKVFGERMGQQTWVRSALGVNTRVTKAIKLILLEKGVTMHKVFLLVGGPDWPTSVLTGVLKIDAIPCQLGTLPVVIPIALTVLAGGAMLKTEEGEWWVNFSALLFTLSGAGLGGSFIFAFVAIERAMETRGAEIDAMLKPEAEGGEFDEEIAAFELEQAAADQIKTAVSSWPVLGTLWQAILVLSLLAMTASTAIFALAPDACFETVSVVTDYRQPPIDSNAFNLVKWPLGWTGLGLQAGSVALLVAFRQMQAIRTKAAPRHLASAARQL